MKKGIIMEINGIFLTLLTPEGEFLRSKRQNEHHQLGEEIYFFPVETPHTAKTRLWHNVLKWKPAWAVSIMAVILLVLGSFLPMAHDNKAYAYMSIDGNSSIELGLNKDMQVVELKGYNKDGKKIISELDEWKNIDVSQVTKSIFASMQSSGLLNENDTVLISTVHTEKPEEKAEEKLKENLVKIKKTVEDKKLNLTVYNATEKEREKAKELGVTTGKYHKNKMESASDNQKPDGRKQFQGSEQGVSGEQAKPAGKETPPGQIKKQSTSQSGIFPGQKWKDQSPGQNSKVAPGQLKKMDETYFKQNYIKHFKEFSKWNHKGQSNKK